MSNGGGDDDPVAVLNAFEAGVGAAQGRVGPIHKGAPYYNSGLLLFLRGDFDGAYYYINEAAKEDKRIGRKSFPDLLIGHHPLSKQILIDPLVRDLCPKWRDDYRFATNCELDEAELKDVFGWFAKRPADAFTVMTALHRLRRTLTRDGNDAVRLSIVRCIADLLVTVESSLRRKQANDPVTGQLKDRLTFEMPKNPGVKKEYDDLERWLTATPRRPQMHSAIGVNGLMAHASTEFDTATSVADHAGIVTYTSYRLRNNILHMNKEALDIFQSRDFGLRIAGWVFATCRIVKHIEDGTFPTL